MAGSAGRRWEERVEGSVTLIDASDCASTFVILSFFKLLTVGIQVNNYASLQTIESRQENTSSFSLSKKQCTELKCITNGKANYAVPLTAYHLNTSDSISFN